MGTPTSRGDAPRPKPVVGVLGGMGSGKSSVAALFARRGARVISADELGHEALRQPEIRERVVARWGAGVVGESGEIDRRRLGRIVFADPAERRKLEELVFPWIEQRMKEQIKEALADPKIPLVLLDAAIMLETGWGKACDRLLYVHTPRQDRLRRLAEHRGWSAEEVERRERAQMPLAEKISRADDVLDNSGPPEETARQVDCLLERWGVAPA